MLWRNVSRIVTAAGVALAGSAGDTGRAGEPPVKPIEVKVAGTAGSFELLRGGRPYFIRGVGGNGSLELLVQAGGNSIRTWGADDLGQTLDRAHRHGLTVTAGIWLGHPDGFDYHDPDAVRKQFEMCREVVRRHKDHPALLMWAFGNEMEGNGKDRKIWEAIEAIAVMSKKLDPMHPTMTVIAEIGEDKVRSIQELCPSIDVIGINSYGGARSLAERYAKQGGKKPYVVTEFGPLGPWEVPNTRWEAPIEASSTAKAELYQASYRAAVLRAKGTCLGAYAFLWGNKQEATATWFGMLLPDGTRLGAVDAMAELWTGRPRADLAPQIRTLAVRKTDRLKPGEQVEATLDAFDPEGGKLEVRWVLTAEAVERLTAGRDERVPPGFPGAIVASTDTTAQVKMPTEGGGYRLFAYVFDEAGGGAVANVPLFVEGPPAASQSLAVELPLVVYGDSGDSMPFSPSGYMGNVAGLKVDLECQNSPLVGDACMEVSMKPGGGWAGLACQYPANDWGEKPQGLDLRGAKRLTFALRGATGGERIKIELGILRQDKRFYDTAHAAQEFTLTSEWRRHSISLDGKDLSRIKTGFVVVVEGSSEPVRFFIDDVRYE